jgi:hypothetical protein
MRRHYRPIIFAPTKHPAREIAWRKSPQIASPKERQDRLA